MKDHKDIALVIKAEDLTLDLRGALESLSRATDLNRPDLFNHLGTLKVNLTVLRNRIDSFLEK